MAVGSLSVTYTSVSLILTATPEVGSLSTVSSAQIMHYAGKAEAEINAKINKLYALPLGVGVPIITSLATDLTAYYLLSRRPLISAQSKADPWLNKFKEAREMLNEIATGMIQLTDDDGAVVPQSTDIMQFWSTTMDYKATFAEDNVENWEVDNDKLDDLADIRDAN